jgi:molybdopterin converting factor small subunit
MPTVKLKVAGWLLESLDSAWTNPEGVSVSISDGETISEMARQLAARNDVFRKIVFDKKNSEFGAEVLVILNGAFVNPQDRSETLLKQGDEVMLLPIVDGG